MDTSRPTPTDPAAAQGYDLTPLVGRLRRARQLRDRSVRQVGIASGLGQSYLARLERGLLRDLHLGSLYRLCAALGVAVPWVVAGRGPMDAPATPFVLAAVVGRLRHARQAADVPARQLGFASGMGESYVGKLERGLTRDMQLGSLHKLCAALGLDVVATLTGAPAPG